MRVFRLIDHSDEDVRGVDGPQVLFVNTSSDEKKLFNRNMYSQFPLDRVEHLYLHQGAILTDVLKVSSISHRGLLVSENFKIIIDDFVLKDIQFVPAVFSNRADIRNYYFMFFNSNLLDELDLLSTEFVAKKVSLIGKSETISFNPILDTPSLVMRKYNVSYAGRARWKMEPLNAYKFKKELSYDVFRIGEPDLSFYFSETAKTILESSGLTGFDLIESKLFE